MDPQANPKMNLKLDILAQKNPFLMTTIGEFNANSKNWYSQDKTSSEGKTIESITCQFGLYQLINETTHLLEIAAKFGSRIGCSPISSS